MYNVSLLFSITYRFVENDLVFLRETGPPEVSVGAGVLSQAETYQLCPDPAASSSCHSLGSPTMFTGQYQDSGAAQTATSCLPQQG